MFESLKRSLFIGGTLVLLATVAFGDGSYQRTKDGKTTVWNNEPRPGDEATWSGSRDREGYASGLGTLSWYTARSESASASGVYARYYGNMVRGKFSGAVNAHSKGKTAHALFVNGERTGRWILGPAPSRQLAQTETVTTKPAPAAEPAAPAEGWSAVPRAQPATEAEIAQNSPPRETEKTPAPRPAETPEPAVEATPMPAPPISKAPRSHKVEADDSLQALIKPPSTLRAVPETPSAPPPEAGPRLSKEEVGELADAEVRTRGYDPDAYRRGEPNYDATDKTWTLSYEQRPFEAMQEPPKHFNVVIDDKTKGRVFLLGK
jgi:hypothetical protein